MVARWGNSLAVRLPRSVIESMSLREGDEVELTPSGPGRLNVVRDTGKEDLVARMEALSRPGPRGYKFDRDEANGR